LEIDGTVRTSPPGQEMIALTGRPILTLGIAKFCAADARFFRGTCEVGDQAAEFVLGRAFRTLIVSYEE
jgi:hypothetical protein